MLKKIVLAFLVTSSACMQAHAGPILTDFVFDVTGILSFDTIGDSDNEVRTLDIGANGRVVGIGWDVTLVADSPSYHSHMSVALGNSALGYALTLFPGFSSNSSGTATFDSVSAGLGVVFDLTTIGFAFNILSDGVLRLEFFESVDNYPDGRDGEWQSGTLRIRVETASTEVPEPSTYALLVMGLVTLTLLARQRRV